MAAPSQNDLAFSPHPARQLGDTWRSDVLAATTRSHRPSITDIGSHRAANYLCLKAKLAKNLN